MASSPTNNSGPPPTGGPLNGGPPSNGGPPPNGGSPPNGSPLTDGPPSNSDTTVSTEIRLFGASSFLILTILSLMANLLLLAVFIKGHKKFKSIPFFLIAYQMLLADFMGLLVDVVLVVPITFVGYDLYGETFRYIIGFFDTNSFNSGFFFVLLLTINRFLTFLFPKIDKIFFAIPNIYGTIAITWLIACGFTAALGISGCMETFNVQQYHIELVVSSHSQITDFLQNAQTYMSMYIPIIMMVFYIFLFLEIKFQLTYILTHFSRPKTVGQSNKKEHLILIQSVILCVTFELKNVVLQAMPQLRMSLHDDNLINILTFSHTWVNIANNTVHTIVIFLFNSMAREIFWVLIGRKKNSTTAITMTMAKTIQVKPAVARSHTIAINRAS